MGNAAGGTASLTLTVTGMHCASCGMLIDDELEEVPGVLSAQTSVTAGRTVVEFDPARCGPQDLRAAIERAGYQAQPDQQAQPGYRTPPDPHGHRSRR